jgi:hypothetical protein
MSEEARSETWKTIYLSIIAGDHSGGVEKASGRPSKEVEDRILHAIRGSSEKPKPDLMNNICGACS